MSSRRTSSIPKDDVFPRMLYCDSRCFQTLPGLSPALPGALVCNVTHHLGDGKCVILRQRVRGSVRAIRALRITRVFQTETRFVADGFAYESCMIVTCTCFDPTCIITTAKGDHLTSRKMVCILQMMKTVLKPDNCYGGVIPQVTILL
jgi:hypothetical protein